MPWFNIIATDQKDHVFFATGQQAAALQFLHMHAYPTKAAAQAATPDQGNYTVNPFLDVGAQLKNTPVGQAVSSAETGINAIGDFFSRLTQIATWERVGEFIAGGIILYIGVKALTTPEGQKVSTQGAKTTLTRIAGKTPPGRIARARPPSGKVVNRSGKVRVDAAKA